MTKCAKKLNDNDINKRFKILVLHIICLSYFVTVTKLFLREKLGLPKHDLILLSVGKLKEQKQPLKLIEVFSLIEKDLDNSTLVIVGKGDLLNKAKDFARRRGVERIIFSGYVKETKYYYASADYYIMASSYEGQPLTLLEAMSSGLPCIVSDIPNLRFIEDIPCGIVVSFNDPDECSKKILRYITKDSRTDGLNGRHYCLNHASWQKIALKYNDYAFAKRI